MTLSGAQIAKNNHNKIVTLKAEGKNRKEIAKILGITDSALANYLYQAQKKAKEEAASKDAINPNILKYIKKNEHMPVNEIKRGIKSNFNVILNVGDIAKYIQTGNMPVEKICKAIRKHTTKPAKELPAKEAKQPAEKTNVKMPNFTIVDGVIRIEHNADLKVSFDGKHYTFSA